MAQECMFCGDRPTTHSLPMRAWEAKIEIAGRLRYVTDEGDWHACVECARLIVNGRRAALAEKMTDAITHGRLERSATTAGVHGDDLALLVRGVLDKVWANREGPICGRTLNG